MKLENQVCSLELAKKLKELGVKQDSLWFWYIPSVDGNDKDLVLDSKGRVLSRDGNFAEVHERIAGFEIIEKFSAFTVAELGEMLLIQFTILKGVQISDPRGRYSRLVKRLYIFEDEANARAKMLIYLLENDLIKNK